MITKDKYLPFKNNADKANRLAIVDPNLADNNISGGTAEIDLVLRCFAEAYIQLSARMGQRQSSGPNSGSLLIDLLGGDYGVYGQQRERLRQIYSGRYGPSNHPLPPKPILAAPMGTALPKVAVETQKESNGYQPNGRRTSSGKVSTLGNTAGVP
jgi:non-canonical poly(A) RNA polymerase PAPD5/7